MDQVEFLGLAHTFVTVSPSNVQHFMPNLLKNGTDTRVEIKEKNNFTVVVREVPRKNYQSHNLIGPYHLLGISPRNSTLFTRSFFVRRRARG